MDKIQSNYVNTSMIIMAKTVATKIDQRGQCN